MQYRASASVASPGSKLFEQLAVHNPKVNVPVLWWRSVGSTHTAFVMETLVAVHTVPSADAPTGMGEPGLPALAPAFANAVSRLTGKRIRELPFKLA